MASRLCRSCREWHDTDQPWPSACASHFRVRSARSDLPRPMVISDYMEARSPVTGEMFTSKSGLRQHYRVNGVRELGNDTIKTIDNDEADIKISQVESDVAQAMLSLGG